MPVSQSYPSPSAAVVGDGAGPFFAPQHQQRMSPPDELRLAAQMSRAHPAVMGTGPNGPDPILVMQHQQHPHVPQAPQAHHGHPVQHVQHHHPGVHLRQSGSPVNPFHPAGAGVGPVPGPSPSPVSGAAAGARAGPNAGQDSAVAEPDTPRKRTKVSRACDECRRKKVSGVCLARLSCLFVRQLRLTVFCPRPTPPLTHSHIVPHTCPPFPLRRPALTPARPHSPWLLLSPRFPLLSVLS